MTWITPRPISRRGERLPGRRGAVAEGELPLPGEIDRRAELIRPPLFSRYDPRHIAFSPSGLAWRTGGALMDLVERILRASAIIGGLAALSLAAIGAVSPWGLLGIVPLIMGGSGW